MNYRVLDTSLPKNLLQLTEGKAEEKLSTKGFMQLNLGLTLPPDYLD